ncbi:MAG: glycosyl hydrolase [Gammaproteobacteria bacterium]|jgi:photosystem II stability/assembly factor-like uncharacterized protein
MTRKAIAAALMSILMSVAAAEDAPEPGLNDETLAGLELRGIGPALMSGRIADIAIHPENTNVWYVAVGSGGVWKTINRGTTWEPVFDEQVSYSIGSVAIDPNDPDTIWVGTGENVSGRHVGYGDGIYRSRDGGKSWTNMGLAASEHISTIRIDPRDSDVIYVAAQGPLWSGGGDRGVYKTEDGGETWNRILSAGEYTGANEVHLDPRDPDVVYAVLHQRMRNVAVLINGGPESGIFKSTDAGASWRELTEGLPEEDMGKIGLAISPQDPDVVYATIELARRTGGFWRSADGGETWEKRNDYLSSGTGPHYYMEIFASPHAFDRVYQMDVLMHVTEDGGKTFIKTPRGAKHSDHHALVFDPDDPDYLLAGTDGGLYESFDLGATWKFVANLPVTQFYKVSVDYDEPFYNVYGGTQDNNTQGGPSRTDTISGIVNSDWNVVLTGDGHQPAADYSNPDIVYAQSQQGFLRRYDRRTGESVSIQPQPGPGEGAERFNWDSPILISPHDPARLYFASQRLWRSDDRGDSWTAISGDLSRGKDRMMMPIMGRVWSFDSLWDLYAMSVYGSVTSVSESPLVPGLIYTGTDDGLIQVTEDGGGSWRKIEKLPGVPAGFFVNDIKADLHDPDSVYVVVDDHKSGDFSPYVLKSTDRGRSWRSIAGDLPDRHVLWRLVQDHVKPDLLFLGTEFGVFFTIDSGRRWVRLGGAPTIPFRDLVIQTRENDLVGATFGRGFYVLDDYTPLRRIDADMLAGETALFPVRDARWYVPRRPLGCSLPDCRSSQGDNFYVAPNPPFGAIFTYYLAEPLMSLKDQRRDREKPMEAEGKDTPFTGWDAMREEAIEEPPMMVLTVRDAAGEIVRHLEGPATAGFHRVSWDLRYPLLDPWAPPSDDEPYTPPSGVMAIPGAYAVSLARRVDGRLEPVGEPQSFEVESIRDPVLAEPDQATRLAFDMRASELQRAVKGSVSAIDELVTDMDAAKEMLRRSQADPALYAESVEIQQQSRRWRDRLTMSEEQKMMRYPGPVPIDSRLGHATAGKTTTVYGPTATQVASLEIAEQEFAEVSARLRVLIDQRLPDLMNRMDAAGVPWSPSRGVPVAD